VVVRALRLDRSLTLNVAHPAAPSIYDLCQALAALLECPAVYEWRNTEAGDLVADVSRLQEVLGFVAAVPWTEGLQRTFR
jgi:nucleoside-diphosphate-sugar epimerase